MRTIARQWNWPVSATVIRIRRTGGRFSFDTRGPTGFFSDAKVVLTHRALFDGSADWHCVKGGERVALGLRLFTHPTFLLPAAEHFARRRSTHPNPPWRQEITQPCSNPPRPPRRLWPNPSGRSPRHAHAWRCTRTTANRHSCAPLRGDDRDLGRRQQCHARTGSRLTLPITALRRPSGPVLTLPRRRRHNRGATALSGLAAAGSRPVHQWSPGLESWLHARSERPRSR